ncbi:MAG: ABC transporter substrate-binding protein [Pseudomonadota bacterium]
MKNQKPDVNNSESVELNFHDLNAGDRDLVKSMVRTGWSRRNVLKLAAATGVTMATAKNLLGSGASAVAQTPQKGGSVRVACDLHGPNDQLDPIRFTGANDYIRGRTLYNNLCQLDDKLIPQSELAVSFSPNKNATEWTFNLRKNVQFHDGSPFTADDVVWSMNRHLGDESTSVLKSVFSSVKEWKKISQYEVKAILNSPNADLPVLTGLFQSKIVKVGSTGGGIGTGPFVLEQFEPGVKTVSVRNEDYWRNPANLDSLEVTAITDPVARVNALLAGDVQMMVNVDPKSIKQIEGSDRVNLVSIPSGAYNGICALKNSKPGESHDFVKGLQYIQDRERIVSKILKGHGSVGNDQPITSAYGTDWCGDLAQREYDPDKAKYHFKKSGYESAELFVAPVSPGIEDMCLLAQANCAKIGFNLNIKKVPNDGYWGSVWRVEPLNVTAWNMRPTANSMLSVAFAPGAAWNDTYWDNERVGKLLKMSLAEIDVSRRKEMYCEIQQLINEHSGMVIPAHKNVLDGVSSTIMGMPKNPLGTLGASEFPEFIWLA